MADQSPGASELEVKTERDTAFGLAEGGTIDVIRVMYRKPPTRRWTRFLLVPDEGQPLEELEQYAPDAAVVHATQGWRRP